ncbi:MAG: SHOCT domain-containing protein [Bacteroidota bacterium]
MGIFIGWFIFSFIVGLIGAERKIGGLAGFFISLILSPIIGLIVVLISSKNSDIKFQQELLEQTKKDNTSGSAKEIEELYNLYKKGILTEAEYLSKKEKILSK